MIGLIKHLIVEAQGNTALACHAPRQLRIKFAFVSQQHFSTWIVRLQNHFSLSPALSLEPTTPQLVVCLI